ncbi:MULTISPECIES: hypothetical protein [Lactiplantibacillus]|uniref:Uncharacterized protein n=1 Tax=Lactiplantibacillus pentosus TaxID=1589 RepID=A0AAW8VU85_LACPE|nr:MULTISPECIES: hypothetical protein [Lactiplantibacillus]MBU7473487.1 hypothetical protein [Lactiplantibacillus pentosus]MCM8608803.1 hypothetical protein [Lactiplantibacillus sp. B652]MDT6988938.1 hypothetical protein [Lactiplantibacillus pentosus]
MKSVILSFTNKVVSIRSAQQNLGLQIPDEFYCHHRYQLKVCLKNPSPSILVVSYTKLDGRSSAIRAASRLEGLADNAQGRNSSCPGGVPGLEEDSYLKLRSDLLREFKSMSAVFQRCQPAPEVGLRRASADEQQSKLALFNHL